jgi:hypothetical protein
MKTVLLAVVAIFAIIFSSCGAADRTLDGPGKYDVNGNKVGGDDLYDEEVLKINVRHVRRMYKAGVLRGKDISLGEGKRKMLRILMSDVIGYKRPTKSI